MIELLNMDCMDYMAGLPDKAFELAIVDPPYGIKADNTRRATGGFYEKWTTRNEYPIKEWDRERPAPSYFSEIFRISRNAIIFGGNFFADLLPAGGHWIVWDKENTMPTFSDAELAWTSMPRNSVKMFRFGWNGLMAKESDRIHPTQKPIALYEWILTHYAKPGDRILDTHLGSGSSGIAAYKLGFDFVGMELDADYYAAACKRFEQHKAQANLFKPDDYDRVTLDYQQQEIL
jgi:site-specific DNA-methyltransferase (adenine-specific)